MNLTGRFASGRFDFFPDQISLKYWGNISDELNLYLIRDSRVRVNRQTYGN